MESFGRVAKIFIDPKANEGYVSDGYLNHRVAVIDLDTGKIKRIWGAYGEPPTDLQTWPAIDPARRRSAPVPQPDALRRGVERRLRLHLRPPERSRPGVHEGRQVREGSVRSSRRPAVGRLGVGHRVLEGRRTALTSTWPTAPTNTCASSTARP